MVEIKNSSVGPPRLIDPTTHCTSNRCSATELHFFPEYIIQIIIVKYDDNNNNVNSPPPKKPTKKKPIKTNNTKY